MKNIFIKKNTEWFAIITFFLLYVCTGSFRYSKVVDYTEFYIHYVLSFVILLLIRNKIKIRKILGFMLLPALSLLCSHFITLFYYDGYDLEWFFIKSFLLYMLMGYFYLSILMILFYKILKWDINYYV